MIKVILVLVYLWKGEAYQAPELRVEQHVYADEAECIAKGGKKAQTIGQDPKFVEGYFAGCIPARIAEAKS